MSLYYNCLVVFGILYCFLSSGRNVNSQVLEVTDAAEGQASSITDAPVIIDSGDSSNSESVDSSDSGESANSDSVNSDDSVTAEKLKCYQCDTIADGDSCWNFDSTHLKPCEDGEQFCRKIHSTIGSTVSVFRSCASEAADPPKCVERTGTKDVKMTYCECQDKSNPGCNTAESIHVKFALVTFISGLLSLVILS